MTSHQRDALRALPKAELHVHLEGSLRPPALLELSRRHGCPFGLADLAACETLYRFADFPGFIHAIKTASQHLVQPDDYAAAVLDLADQQAAQGVVYSEVFLSVGILLWRQVEIPAYWQAVETARQDAERRTGVRMRWLFDAVRQFGPAHFEQVLEWAIRLRGEGSVIGIGIGGDEARGPAAWFADGYRRARAAGLHTTVHAGETRGPESVWDAIRLLEAERIGHGLRAFEDPALVAELVRRRIPLDVCPTSNRRTGCWTSDQPHPAQAYLRQGVRLSISTDDPGIFATSLLDEYGLLIEEWGLSLPDVARLAANSFNCSFSPPTPDPA